MRELDAIVEDPIRRNSGGILATLVTVEGSSYRRPAARLFVARDGKRIGSISGGCLENDVLLRNRTVAETGRADLVVFDTTSENNVVWGVGTGCHGVSIQNWQLGNLSLISTQPTVPWSL